jgi:uncharacterized protein (TIGR02145 family)
VTSTSVTGLTTIQVTFNAEVNSQGGGTVTERGAVWNTSGNPTVNSNRVPSGFGTGVYTANLTGLSANSNYYVRAYAVNPFGFSYGLEFPFSTLTGLVTLTTNNVFSQGTTATTGGNITDSGGSIIIERGVVWNTNGNPTILDNKTTDGIGTGLFTSFLVGLIPNTTYYLKAYAINSAGIAYGNQITFTTAAVTIELIDIDGNIYKTIKIGNQIWMQDNLRVSRFKNGIEIPYIIDGRTWGELVGPAWSYYSNETTFNLTYGKIYNGFALQSNNGICPDGWRVPSQNDFNELITFLGGYAVAGGKIKVLGTTGATNSSGFSALLGGNRYVYGSEEGGRFEALGYYGFIWTDSLSAIEYWTWSENIGSRGLRLNDGAYIRCLKN